MKKIKKRLYIGGYITGTILFLLLCSLGIGIGIVTNDAFVLPICLFVGIIPLMLAWVFGLLILYKMWAVIRYIGGRASPWQAVIFLLIPFYNFYWVFQAYWGWTKDYNMIAKENSIKAPRMPEGVALAASISWIASTVFAVVDRGFNFRLNPFYWILITSTHMILMAILYIKACNGINAMSDALVEKR